MQTDLTNTEELARAATAFQAQLTGHPPKSASVVVNGDVLVITLHDALTPAEKALARDPAGAARVQDFHRQLFLSSAAGLCQEIKRIMGQDVREAAAEIAPATGAVVHAFTTGTVVQVFEFIPQRAA